MRYKKFNNKHGLIQVEVAVFRKIHDNNIYISINDPTGGEVEIDSKNFEKISNYVLDRLIKRKNITIARERSSFIDKDKL